MNRNETLGRFLLDRGLVSRDVVSKAYAEARRLGVDLCAVLVAWQQLSVSDAQTVRWQAFTAAHSAPPPHQPTSAPSPRPRIGQTPLSPEDESDLVSTARVSMPRSPSYSADPPEGFEEPPSTPTVDIIGPGDARALRRPTRSDQPPEKAPPTNRGDGAHERHRRPTDTDRQTTSKSDRIQTQELYADGPPASQGFGPLSTPDTIPPPHPPGVESDRLSTQPLGAGKSAELSLEDNEKSPSPELPGLPARISEDYEILGELSRGGMGVIYEGKHRHLGTRVAIKLILRSRPSPSSLARFRREARALAQISHPNVVRLNEYGEEDGKPFFVMELVKGKDLNQIIKESLRREGRTPHFELATRACAAIGRALMACHERGIVHRDLKPHNIIIEAGSERPVLIDFGLVKRDRSKLMDNSGSDSLTKTGQVVGTPAFLSPEQIKPSAFGEVTEQADVWGLAATLYYTLTGKLPFDAASPTSIFLMILEEPAPRIRADNPKVPVWLEDLLRRCLRKKPSQRPSMEDFVKALERQRLGGFGRLSRVRWGSLAGLSLFIFLATLAAWRQLNARPLEFRKLEPKGEIWTKHSRIELKGEANRSGTVSIYRVRRGGRDFDGSAEAKDGTYARSVLLDEGLNEFWVLFQAGGEKQSSKFRVHCDRTAPQIELEGEQSGCVFLGVTGRLRGRLKDASAASLSLNGVAISLAKDGSFSGLPELSDEILLVALDRAGNEARRRVRVLYEKDLDELLKNRVRWDGASPMLQDMAIRRAASKLGPSMHHTDTKIYSCGAAERHRIARFLHKPTGIEFMLIPGGSFRMGTPDPDAEATHFRGAKSLREQQLFSHEAPAHQVILQPFLIGRTTVTSEQWAKGQGTRARPGLVAGWPQPAAWGDAVDWLAKVGDGLRLPSEAEWEYAARGGASSRYPWGATIDSQYCFFESTGRWLEPNRKQPIRAVYEHQARPNGFGLIDVCGNVWELCADGWIEDHRGAPEDGAVRKGSRTLKVRKGGSSSTPAAACRPAARDAIGSSATPVDQSFRVLRRLP